ncbi:MAG TPA: hypothetical protein PKY89_16815, partial [Deltaproteobacteria bacterium]|nr:hypothetical protein [Deltaproteobacteria bacterium]
KIKHLNPSAAADRVRFPLRLLAMQGKSPDERHRVHFLQLAAHKGSRACLGVHTIDLKGYPC